METRSIAGIEVPEDVLAFHGSLSRSALEFLDYVDEHPVCCEASTFRPLEVRSDFLRYPLQGWPILVREDLMDQMRRVSVDVCAIFRRVPEVVFGNDRERIMEYYGFDRSYAEMLVDVLRDRETVSSLLSRGDFVLTDDGLKCIELNATSYLGGWESATWTRMVLGVSEVREYLDGRGVPYRYGDTAKAFFRHVVSRAYDALLFEDDLNMALATPVDDRRTSATLEFGRQTLRETVKRLTGREGGDLSFCRFDELREKMGCLFLDGKRIHVVLEQYQGGITPEAFRCSVRGGVHVYNGLPTGLFADKRNLALLSELDRSDLLSDAERKTIRDHVPWTRAVEAVTTIYEGREVFLPDLMLAARTRLVLKRALGAQGDDVFIGAARSPAEWEERVRWALGDDDPWVIQERCLSRPFLGQFGEFGHTPHDLVWGLFVFGDRCPGGFIRMMPQREVGVINASRGATEGVIIEVSEGTSPQPDSPKEVVR